jgi:type IV pilus biogenesis protein PilP
MQNKTRQNEIRQIKTRQNKFAFLALACVLAFTGAAHAESASDTLTRIEAETLILKAREKQLDVQASILAKQNEIAVKQVVHDQISQPSVAGDPLVRAVEGIGKKMFATLQMSNGTLIDAQVGDTLSNGMRIVFIRQNEVIVEAGKRKRVRLSSYANATPFNPSYPNAGVSLPPALPLIAPGGIK